MADQLLHIDTGARIDLVEFNMLGRAVDATIPLEDASVSRQHASIRRQGKEYWLTDLGSSNYTYLNGLVVRTPQKIVPGDRLRFGSVEFEFVSGDPGEISDQLEGGMFQTQVLTRSEPVVQTRPVVMLVGDIKAYSRLSSKLAADDLAKLMNHWYEKCRDFLKQKEAVIDKFTGDCVFAYWHSDGPRARQLALDVATALADSSWLLTDSQKQMLLRVDASFDCCIGMHVGEVALSGASQDDFTALGDAVNLAFRIEGLTRDLDQKILASSAFVSDWDPVGVSFQSCGLHEVKGFSEPVEVYSVGA